MRSRRSLPAIGDEHRTLGVSRVRRSLEHGGDSRAGHGEPIGHPVRHRRRVGVPSSTRRVPSCRQVVWNTGSECAPVDSGRGDLEGGTSRPAARIGSHPDTDVDRRGVAVERRLIVVGLLASSGRRFRLDGGCRATDPSTRVRRSALVLTLVSVVMTCRARRHEGGDPSEEPAPARRALAEADAGSQASPHGREGDRRRRTHALSHHWCRRRHDRRPRPRPARALDRRRLRHLDRVDGRHPGRRHHVVRGASEEGASGTSTRRPTKRPAVRGRSPASMRRWASAASANPSTSPT